MLVILVIMAALVAPVLQGPLENQRLRNSGDVVRAEWAKARTRAIQTGRIHVFRYQVNDNRYWTEPWFADDDYLESSVDLSQANAPSRSAALASESGIIKQLPQGVRFVSGVTAGDARSAEFDQQMMAGGMGGAAARPILFYPDGTTSTARVILGNERQRFVDVQLRGLTGVSKKSDISTGDQIAP